MAHSKPLHVLIIGYVWPERNASAAGVRDWSLVRAFQRAGWKVSYCSPAKENEFTELLRAEKIRAESIPANDPRFDAFVAELRPDVVVFDRFMIEEAFGWRVEQAWPQALRVLDTVDLHFVRRARERALRAGVALEAIASLGEGVELESEDLLRELAAIHRADLTLVLSDWELELLRTRYGVPAASLELCRLAYPAPATQRAEFSARQGFVMIGNFRHPPNVDAIRWFKAAIWPRVRQVLPRAETHVYGAYPSREMMDLDDESSGFRVKGWAEDAIATLGKYRVNLAPLRYGAGIKGKLCDGWLAGTPAAATPIAAEGMCEGLAFGGLVAQTPKAFADAAIRLHEEEPLWRESVGHGDALLATLYREELHDSRLIHAIESALAARDRKRASNHVGRILRHQLHRSTEYFSRWIELKEAGQRQADRHPDAP